MPSLFVASTAAALAFAVSLELYIQRPISSSESSSSELADAFLLVSTISEEEVAASGLHTSTLSIVGMVICNYL